MRVLSLRISYWQLMGCEAQIQRAPPAPREVHTQAVRIALSQGVRQMVSVLSSQATLPPRTSLGHTPRVGPASVPASREQLIRTHAYSIVLVPGSVVHVQ
jgi:hypothetical protein